MSTIYKFAFPRWASSKVYQSFRDCFMFLYSLQEMYYFFKIPPVSSSSIWASRSLDMRSRFVERQARLWKTRRVFPVIALKAYYPFLRRPIQLLTVTKSGFSWASSPVSASSDESLLSDVHCAMKDPVRSPWGNAWNAGQFYWLTSVAANRRNEYIQYTIQVSRTDRLIYISLSSLNIATNFSMSINTLLLSLSVRSVKDTEKSILYTIGVADRQAYTA